MSLGPLDKLPASWRHFLLLAAGGAAAYALPAVQADYLNWNLPVPVSATLGVLLPYAVLWATKATTQYGYVGNPTPAPTPTAPPAP